jgi:hypothetical protein
MNQDSPYTTCQGCGAVLAKEGDEQPGKPCPQCGDTRRQFHVFASDHVTIDSRAVAHRLPTDDSGESEGVRIAGPGTRSAGVDFISRASVTYDIAGDAPRHEEGALETAQILIQKLRESDPGWSDPTIVDRADVDCESHNGEDTLLMQVTRVPRSSSFWQSLGQHSAASQAGSADNLADDLMTAINHKASRLPSTQRAALALVLDARDTPAFAMTGTVARFTELHGTEATNLGFRSIWVVGPTVNLVRQLA